MGTTTPPTPAGVPQIRTEIEQTAYPTPVQGQVNWVKELAQIPPQVGLI